MVLLPAFAQVAITGKITATDGKNVPFATITLKGTTKAALSDNDGHYSLVVDRTDGTLVVTCMGYAKKEIPINDKTTVNFTIEAENQALEEVKIIGYGTQKKRDLTGSMASVGEKTLKEMPVASFEQALQGRTSGVQVTQSNSAPGGSISIRIRGGNSVLGGSEPLYVIDGYPVSNASLSTTDSQPAAGNPLSTINPNDIVSIDILKDASSTAIYGSRGANGVVIITTRRGKAGKGQVDFETYRGMQRIRHEIPLLNAQQYIQIANQRATNNGTAIPYPSTTPFTANTNWEDEVFKTAPIANYSLAFSGGSEESRYLVSGNWFDQHGIVVGSGFKRGSIRANLDSKLSSKFSIATSLAGSRSINDQARATVSLNRGGIYLALVAPPVAPALNPDGSYFSIGSVPTADPAWNNPLALLQGQTFSTTTNRFLGNTNLRYQILPELSFSVRLGIDYNDFRADDYAPRYITFGAPGGVAAVAEGNVTDLLNENILAYKKQWGDHSFDFTAGYTWQQNVSRTLSATTSGFNSDVLTTNNLGSGSVIGVPGTDKSQSTLQSWLGRINYSYKGKYLATVSARDDGSSRFGNGNKYGFFPSGALAWRISEEGFLKEVKWLNNLKIRTSVGVTGNQEIGNYNSLARLNAVSAVFGTSQNQVIGYAPTSFPNPNLRWETTTQYDGGVDGSFFNSRLNLSLDYYLKNTTNLLAQVPVPLSSGFSSILLNSGSMRNQGFEIAADGVLIDQGKFKWNAGINFSTNKNKVLAVAVQGGQFFAPNLGSPIDNPVNIIKEGLPLSAFYGYKTDGLWQTNQTTGSIQPTAKAGDQKYADLNGDGQITADDRTVLGKPNPDFIYGFNSQLTYGAFTLNFVFQGIQGATVFNANLYSISDSFARGGNQISSVMDYWTPTNTGAKYPRPSSVNPLISDRFFEDASYLRMKNIQLAYNVPASAIKWLRSAQIYVSGQNLLTWTKYTGFDPEVSSALGTDLRKGIDVGAYPSAKTVTVGVRVGL
jgi:TonB-linked SusC/RagA family outer membrane protein